jgi:hypothetical protein
MNKKKIKEYLENKGIPLSFEWTVEDLISIMDEVEFKGEETGGLKFLRAKSSGRRYIQFQPGRCYIDD